MEKKIRVWDVVVIGLALFAMFFGASNLIYPPWLGRAAGEEWLIGSVSFCIADAGLALVALLSILKGEDLSIAGVTGRVGALPAAVLNTLVVLCIGPFLAIPRTAATTYEMAVVPFWPALSSWWFGLFFFGLVLLFSLRPGRVVDLVGRALTPVLAVGLLALILAGVLRPIGPVVPPQGFGTVKEGVLAGYQTMDVIAALIFVSTLVTAARGRGYTGGRGLRRVVGLSGAVAAALLLLVYGGLAYLGATASGGGFDGHNQAGLLVAITRALAGRYGAAMLAVVVFFACLTTAVGLVASCAAYFERLARGRASYRLLVVGLVAFSYLVSNIGLSAIISIAAPVLSVLYPVILVLILLNFFSARIPGRSVYRFAAAFALAASAAEVLEGFGLPLGPFSARQLPLGRYQCGWVLPALAGAALGWLVSALRRGRQ